MAKLALHQNEDELKYRERYQMSGRTVLADKLHDAEKFISN